MTRLNQVLAVEKTIKGDTEKALTALYHRIQKNPLLSGITRTYRKVNDDDTDLPGESTLVQVKTDQVLVDVAATLTRLFDVTATKDWTNCKAVADIVCPDGTTLLASVPVTYLLFLEKALVNLETFIRKLPTLDPAENWSRDETTDTWRTDPAETTRTKKIPRNHVKAPATDKHPAQVDVFTEDVVVGYWETIRFSGALPAQRVNELLARVIGLAEAVKFAREAANSIEVDAQKPGKAIFDYLFR